MKLSHSPKPADFPTRKQELPFPFHTKYPSITFRRRWLIRKLDLKLARQSRPGDFLQLSHRGLSEIRFDAEDPLTMIVVDGRHESTRFAIERRLDDANVRHLLMIYGYGSFHAKGRFCVVPVVQLIGTIEVKQHRTDLSVDRDLAFAAGDRLLSRIGIGLGDKRLKGGVTKEQASRRPASNRFAWFDF